MSGANLTTSEEQILSSKGYKLMDCIGEGVSGKVFMSEMRVGNKAPRTMACKFIDASLIRDSLVLRFLHREINILKKLSHPNIVHIFAIYHQSNKYMIFMRYAEKGDLLDFLLRHGELPEKVMKCWFFQIVSAVQYLHTIDIAHRDIKCENILITNQYNAKLTDFGFSKTVTDEFGKLIESNTFCGSPTYVAPEILKGKPYFPKPTDVWSLGVLLFVTLNKSVPFAEKNLKKMLKRQTNRDFVFRTKVAPRLSEEVVLLVKRLLDPDVKTRPTCNEILEDSWFKMNGKKMKPTKEEERALNHALIYKKSKGERRRTRVASIENSEIGFLMQKERESYTSYSAYGPKDMSVSPSIISG